MLKLLGLLLCFPILLWGTFRIVKDIEIIDTISAGPSSDRM